MLRRVPAAGVVVVLVIATVIAHFAIIGWDTEYDVDPVSGQVSGPYGTAQVLLLAAVLLVLAAWGAWRGPAGSAFVVAVVYTVCWSITASATDTSGLWLVGAVLVACGTAAGAAVCTAMARSARPGRSRSRS